MVCSMYPVQPPVEPHGDGGDDEGVAVEQRGGLGGHVLGEVLQEELVLLGEALLLASHHLDLLRVIREIY